MNPLVRVVSPSQLVEAEARAALPAEDPTFSDLPLSELAGYIRRKLEEMRSFRESEGINSRLLAALRAYRGQYDPQKLAQIAQFQGSEVYARIVATKCRLATSLLRDIYLGSEQPWELAPTPVPVLPDDVKGSIASLVASESRTAQAAGEPVDMLAVGDRVRALHRAAQVATRAKAAKEAKDATRKLDDVLTEGGFYDAFASFLSDLPVYPYAVLKGPVIKRVSKVVWENGMPVQRVSARPTWVRVSPFDLYWSPNSYDPKATEYVERVHLSRLELPQMRGLPGFDTAAIDEVLKRFTHAGNYAWWDSTEVTRDRLEDREGSAAWSGSTTIDTAEFHGFVPASMLRTWGLQGIPEDAVEDYYVTAWLIDRHVIKVQIEPYSFQPSPYYVGKYSYVPGSLIGEGLPDILADIQDVANATLRALVNNLSIASGPQVVINDAALSPGESDVLHPWRRWHINIDPALVASGQEPVKFWQPSSNSQELLDVYQRLAVLADEVSMIPRYMAGSDKVGGAGRTASGLAMLIANASKALQDVAARIDRDVVGPALKNLYDYVRLTEPDVLRGDEEVVVKGVHHAIRREQDRLRQLEFLQITANPVDLSIVGPTGRAKLLHSVAEGLGLDGVLPDPELTPPSAPMAAPGGTTPPAPSDAVRAPAEAAREQVEGIASGG